MAIADCDSAPNGPFYINNATLNSPRDGFYLGVQFSLSDAYFVQMAFKITPDSGVNHLYFRIKVSGISWYPWQNVY